MYHIHCFQSSNLYSKIAYNSGATRRCARARPPTVVVASGDVVCSVLLLAMRCVVALCRRCRWRVGQRRADDSLRLTMLELKCRSFIATHRKEARASAEWQLLPAALRNELAR